MKYLIDNKKMPFK